MGNNTRRRERGGRFRRGTKLRDSRHEAPRILRTRARAHEQYYRGRAGRLARLGRHGRAKRERERETGADGGGTEAQPMRQVGYGIGTSAAGPQCAQCARESGQPRSDFLVGEIGGFWQMVLKWSPQKVRKTTCVPGKRSDNGELPQAREARLGEHTVISRPTSDLFVCPVLDRSWNTWIPRPHHRVRRGRQSPPAPPTPRQAAHKRDHSNPAPTSSSFLAVAPHRA